MRVVERLMNLCDSSKENGTDHRIAQLLLDNLAQVQRLSLAELAQRCYVSQSTLLRFLKKAGYASYALFLADIQSSVSDFEYRNVYVSQSVLRGEPEHAMFLENTVAGLKRVGEQVPQELVEQVCRGIHESRRLLLFGMDDTLHTRLLTAAVVFSGRCVQIVDRFHLPELEELELSASDCCLFLRAVSPGSQIYDPYMQKARESGSRLVMIANAKAAPLRELCDYALCFDGQQSYVDYYGMETIVSMLAITYKELYMPEIRKLQKEPNKL